MPLFDVRQEIEVFFVFIHSAVTPADHLLRLDEAYSADLLDHFEPELVLDTQSERCTVNERQGRVVHFVGKQALGLDHVLEALGIVRDPPSPNEINSTTCADGCGLTSSISRTIEIPPQ